MGPFALVVRQVLGDDPSAMSFTEGTRRSRHFFNSTKSSGAGLVGVPLNERRRTEGRPRAFESRWIGERIVAPVSFAPTPICASWQAHRILPSSAAATPLSDAAIIAVLKTLPFDNVRRSRRELVRTSGIGAAAVFFE